MYQKLQELQTILKKSNYKTIPDKLENFKEVITKLDTYRDEISILLDKFHNPLKMVILGEVKAGKSTLINVFAGETISTTNVTETTACIIELKHGLENIGIITKKNGEVAKYPTNVVYEKLSQHRGDFDYFNEIDRVKLELPLSNLQKLHIVDTPGLGTITLQNQNTTMEYIQNADVVLWVFSAHHLGQSDIEEYLGTVKSYGKPIIAVINRIDEIGGSAEELEEYVMDQLGFYIDKAIAISANQAFIGFNNDDNNLIQNSRYQHLLDYLTEQINEKDKEVQYASILNSAIALSEKEKINQELLYNDIEFRVNMYTKVTKRLENEINVCSKEMIEELEVWHSKEFLSYEKAQILNEIDKIGMFNQSESSKKIELLVQKEFGEAMIKEIIEKKHQKISEEIHIQYGKIISEINKDIVLETEELINKQKDLEEELKIKTISIPGNIDMNILDGTVTGTMIGTAGGITASIFSAAFGPAAAYVTIGTALSTFLLPVALTGAGIGMGYNIWKGMSSKDKLKAKFGEEIEKFVSETKRNLQIVEMYRKQINEIEVNIKKEFQEKLQENLFCKWTLEDFKVYIEQNKFYQSELDSWEVDAKHLLQANVIRKHITNQEIINKFLETLINVKEEIDIISPWLGAHSFKQHKLFEKFEAALSRGVKVRIIYGIEGNGSKSENDSKRMRKCDEIANQMMERYRKYGDLFKIEKRNTHEKLLICDHSFYMIGSYNLLSFSGEYIIDTRDESMEMVEDKEMLKYYRERYFCF